MKIRLQANKLVFRISENELEELSSNFYLEETIDLPDGRNIKYIIKVIGKGGASFSSGLDDWEVAISQEDLKILSLKKTKEGIKFPGFALEVDIGKC